jgi:HAD superfamily hydrolase (TIGR01509 family)
MTRPVLFLDDGGVMNNNRRRGRQWQRLVAEFFAPRLGGTPQARSRANRIVSSRLLEPAAWQARVQAAPDYRTFDYRYQLDWLHTMGELVAVPLPAEEACYQLALEATAAITRRVQAAFPGASEAIRRLHRQGYLLYTASGEPSTDVANYLWGMGVRACFQRLYGPDLIETFKAGPAYYERVFADAGVDPQAAVVVDDSLQALAWARQAGARTVLMGTRPLAQEEAAMWSASLAELPAIMDRLE